MSSSIDWLEATLAAPSKGYIGVTASNAAMPSSILATSIATVKREVFMDIMVDSLITPRPVEDVNNPRLTWSATTPLIGLQPFKWIVANGSSIGSGMWNHLIAKVFNTNQSPISKIFEPCPSFDVRVFHLVLSLIGKGASLVRCGASLSQVFALYRSFLIYLMGTLAVAITLVQQRANYDVTESSE